MKLHEYQAKEVFSRYGVPVPRGIVASTPEEAVAAARDLGGRAVVKAQVHAGGRGKAGGVRLVASPEEAGEVARQLLGSRLVTFQTGARGVPVHKLLVEEPVAVDRELYLGLVIDGSWKGPVIIASAAGGMEIEEVARTAPEKVLRAFVDPALGYMPHQGRQLAYKMGLPGPAARPFADLVGALYRLFVEKDCSLAEINPLVVTEDGRLLALDAKLELEDDALFRHPEARQLRDESQDEPLEVEARRIGVSYVKLDGDVGCIVNGAGLAMATMDVIVAAGASPANFLDVGGSADEEKTAAALKMVLSDPNVRLVLVNIFGGILRNDVAARGFLKAAQEEPEAMRPMVVRMLGTNAEEGRRLLADSGLDVTFVEDLAEAAQAIKAKLGS